MGQGVFKFSNNHFISLPKSISKENAVRFGKVHYLMGLDCSLSFDLCKNLAMFAIK